MSAVAEAAGALLEALQGVAGARVYSDPGATLDPPALLLGPPSLTWETVCSDPTSARFIVYVVVKVSERAMEQLWELVPEVAQAIDATTDATVRQADPGTWKDLPAYEIQVEVSL